MELPVEFPTPLGTIRKEALVRDRFFLNYCTYGYTMPWWKWPQWMGNHFMDIRNDFTVAYKKRYIKEMNLQAVDEGIVKTPLPVPLPNRLPDFGDFPILNGKYDKLATISDKN